MPPLGGALSLRYLLCSHLGRAGTGGNGGLNRYLGPAAFLARASHRYGATVSRYFQGDQLRGSRNIDIGFGWGFGSERRVAGG